MSDHPVDDWSSTVDTRLYKMGGGNLFQESGLPCYEYQQQVVARREQLLKSSQNSHVQNSELVQ